MKSLHAFSRLVYGFCVFSMAGALCAMFVCVITQVILRTFFKTTFLPFEDLVVYTFTISIFMGVAVLFRDKGHLATPMLVDLLPPATRRIVIAAIEGIVFVFLLMLLFYGVDYTLDSFSSYSPSLNIPMGWIFLSIPVSAGCSLLFMIERVCAALTQDQAVSS